MNAILQIKQNENMEPVISGRQLHEFLEVKEKYTQWFDRMVAYGFEENTDFMSYSEKTEKPQGGRPSIDHMIKIDMAKELSMIQRTEKGKQARQYFLQVEKEYNSPEKIMARALQIAHTEINTLKLTNNMQLQQIKELKPKADYTDKILKSKSLVLTSQIAKDYGMSAQQMNKTLSDLKVQYKMNSQWLLYSKYHDKGYTSSETFEFTDRNGNIKTNMTTKWTQKGRLFLYNLLKENSILPMIEQDNDK